MMKEIIGKMYNLLSFLFRRIFLFAENKSTNQLSLHVLLATIGRSSLIRMLKSLQFQLQSSDYLTVVFDAQDVDGVYSQTEEILKEFSCHYNIIMEPTNLGFWGHGVRNKYNQLQGDFILHADD